MRPPGPGPQPRHRNKPRARNFLPQKLFRGSKGAQKLGLVDVLQQEGFRVDTWKNFLALELLRLCDFSVRRKSPLPGGLKMACSRGRAQQPEGLLPGPLLHPQTWQPPHLSRFRMGWKYLEVLIAKMTLGIRKKAHQPRQNQKAFWNRGGEVNALCLGTPSPPADSMWGTGTHSQS